MSVAVTELTIVITNFNGREVLESTLAAIAELPYADLDVVLVDDGSTDGSLEYVRRHHPRVRIASMGRNTRRLNAVRNRALSEAATRYVLLIDNDITVNEDCIEKLMQVMLSRSRVLCCTPRLLYSDDPNRIYHDGGRLHYLGVSADMVRGVTTAERPPRPPYRTIGCGIMLIDRALAQELDGFDEDYLIGWGDDGEFQARGVLRGFHVLHVPQAACLHVDRPHGRARIFGQIYNRYRFILTLYSGRALILLLPAFIVFECALAALGVLKGFAPDQFRALMMIIRDRQSWMRRRRDVQAARYCGDRALLEAGRLTLGSKAEQSKLIALGAAAWSGVFHAYWRLVGWAIPGEAAPADAPVREVTIRPVPPETVEPSRMSRPTADQIA